MVRMSMKPFTKLLIHAYGPGWGISTLGQGQKWFFSEHVLNLITLKMLFSAPMYI